MKAGAVITIPDLPGRWTVWSKSDETPGTHFAVPLDDAARQGGAAKYAVVKITNPKTQTTPLIRLIRTDPITLMPKETPK